MEAAAMAFGHIWPFHRTHPARLSAHAPPRALLDFSVHKFKGSSEEGVQFAY